MCHFYPGVWKLKLCENYLNAVIKMKLKIWAILLIFSVCSVTCERSIQDSDYSLKGKKVSNFAWYGQHLRWYALICLNFIFYVFAKNQKENAIGQVSLFILESTHKNHLKGHELTYVVFIDWIGPKNQREKAISQVSFFHPHTRIIWKPMNP